jgi:polyisoprenoid-binding protein YceI
VKTAVLAPAVVLLSLVAPAAPAATWTVADGSEVVFTSKAPMETFDGRTRAVSGHVSCDPADLAAPIDLRVEVELATLDTGIGMRNSHMRERHLQTDQFPLAVLTATAIKTSSAPSLAAGQTVDVTIAGDFDLHGVKRPMEIAGAATLGADGGLTVEAAFMIRLSDHDIARPQFLVMKLADEQQVRVTLVCAAEGSR